MYANNHSILGIVTAFETVRQERAGESGVQLSAGTEMEAYGDQAAAASNQLF